jgi:hypothetical protein
MATGPGKYDYEATKVMLSADAKAAIIIVLDGNRGSGFSCQFSDPLLMETVPEILRRVADQIESDVRLGGAT